MANYEKPIIHGIDSAGNATAFKAGVNGVLQTGVRGFRAAANFTRPSDTTAYAVWDAISNSTSAPSIMSVDLTSFGAVANQFVCFTNARIISSVAQATLPQVNVFLSNQTFTATNDNAQFSVSDAIAQGETLIIPCLNTYNLSANSRCVSDSGQWVFQLGATTNIFFALQAANAYTPASGERFDVILEGFLL